MRTRRVIVLGNGRKTGVVRAVEDLLPWLREQADVVLVDLDMRDEHIDVKADLTLVFGGDGTILAAAHRLAEREIPVIGVNFGKFGFLAELSMGELRERLDSILAGECVAARRVMLRCVFQLPGEPVAESVALNEVAVMAETARMAAMALYIDDELATTYQGDGLIVATPVGSTAHSLSAGGPVMHPDMDALVITPVCPHTLTNRPLVLGASARVRIVNESDDIDLTVATDGRVSCAIPPGGAVNLERFAHPFLLIETLKRSFFRTLRDKLNWGGHPNYDVRQGD